jgi:hypothetical protein
MTIYAGPQMPTTSGKARRIYLLLRLVLLAELEVRAHVLLGIKRLAGVLRATISGRVVQETCKRTASV